MSIALRALEIGNGDEVILPSHTAVATAAAVVSTGATPVYVDINPSTYTIDPSLFEAAKSSRTKALIAVHLYGQACDMDEILKWTNENGITLLEDCAQAHGAAWKGKRVGTFGLVSCFSFYPTKNLGAVGDGGGILTNDPVIYEKIVRLRQYGWGKARDAEISSTVSRLDEIQAAILRVKLRHLDEMNNARQKHASFYSTHLDNSAINLPMTSTDAFHVFHLYVIQVRNREKFISELRQSSIFPGIHYEYPVHLNSGYRNKIGKVSGNLTHTELVAKRVLSLPMYPELTTQDLERICEAVNNV